MSSIPWTEVREAIFDWVAASSGLAEGRIIWEKQRAPQPPAGTYISLDLDDERQYGQDWTAVESAPSPTAGAEIVHKVRGVRIVRLTITCYAHGEKWITSQPGARIQSVIAARQLPLRAQSLRASGIGFGPIGRVQDVSVERSTIFEPRSTVEITLHLASEVSELGTYIETVELTNETTEDLFQVARPAEISANAGAVAVTGSAVTLSSS